MDEFLEAMYNTRENIGLADGGQDDIEKMAEAELVAATLQEEGYDLDRLDGNDILKVAHALFGANSALVKSAQEESEEEEEEESPALEKAEEKAEEKVEKMFEKKKEGSAEEDLETKLAHADFLGRVMAHSFVDEWAKMEKAAQVEQIKVAKAQQFQQSIQGQGEQPSQVDGLIQKIAAMRGEQLAPEPEVDEEKVAYALQLLKEAGVPLDA